MFIYMQEDQPYQTPSYINKERSAAILAQKQYLHCMQQSFWASKWRWKQWNSGESSGDGVKGLSMAWSSSLTARPH